MKNIVYDFVSLTIKIIMTKLIALITAALLTASVQVHAQEPSCAAAATEKKLAGAAKTSFLKKCEKDATAKCEAAAAERKLAGAAKNSNIKKCVKDTVGDVS